MEDSPLVVDRRAEGRLAEDRPPVAERPLGAVHFAHSDLSALPLLEEAVYWGTRVAAEVALVL